MFGIASPCAFVVLSNAGPGGDEALAKWYMEIHGPDAMENGTFTALHRYQAIGSYDARFLAVWEGRFTSLSEARDTIVPNAAGLKKKGRISDDLVVVWSAMHFLTDSSVDAD